MTKITVLVIVMISAVCMPVMLFAEGGDSPAYLEVGITSSSLVHLSVGYGWGRMSVRMAGMYLGKDCNEFLFNLGYAFYDSPKVQHSVNLLTSWVAGKDPGAKYRYGATGIAYSLYYRGFFLELGLAYPWRDEVGNLSEDLLIPCGYWGYLYRIRI